MAGFFFFHVEHDAGQSLAAVGKPGAGVRIHITMTIMFGLLGHKRLELRFFPTLVVPALRNLRNSWELLKILLEENLRELRFVRLFHYKKLNLFTKREISTPPPMPLKAWRLEAWDYRMDSKKKMSVLFDFDSNGYYHGSFWQQKFGYKWSI